MSGVVRYNAATISESGGMESIGRFRRSLPAGAGWFFIGAALFAGGAINAAWHGLHQTMQIGLLGAAAALGVAYVFCDWLPRSGRRRRS
jgi:hypothetical protein